MKSQSGWICVSCFFILCNISFFKSYWIIQFHADKIKELIVQVVVCHLDQAFHQVQEQLSCPFIVHISIDLLQGKRIKNRTRWHSLSVRNIFLFQEKKNKPPTISCLYKYICSYDFVSFLKSLSNTSTILGVNIIG